MLSKQDLSKLYETVLTIPGMHESVKVDVRLTRKSVLLLSKVIERGLSIKTPEEKGPTILEIVSPETLSELNGVAEELLLKAGLTEMNEKLNSF